MKIFLYIFFILQLTYIGLVFGQAKNDFIWILGNPTEIPSEYFGGTIIDFNQNKVDPLWFNSICDATEPSVLSSTTGRLLSYSNGCNIYHAEHGIMENGDSISYGANWDTYCEYGYPGTQNNLYLPFPGDTNKAILFYLKILDGFSSHHLLYSIIEFNESHPLGILTVKDQFLLDPGRSGLVTATKHGNGRDWWLVLPEYYTNRFFSILLDPTGVSIQDTQIIGKPWGDREWASQAVFTPDGSKYIRFNPWKGLDICEFDRCSGQLYNILESGPLSDPVHVAGGVAVSANSRYLYVANHLYLYQYDLHSSGIFNSKQLIGEYDGFLDPFQTNFYQMMLAPDEKIYVFATSGNKSIHVIENPELPGVTCNLSQHSFKLPTYILGGSINVPFFRLGPMDDSYCDTLGLDNQPIADFRYEIDSLVPGRVMFRNCSYFNPDEFQWQFGNNSFSQDENPLPVVYDTFHSYTVCLIVSNSYGADTVCKEIIFTDSTTNTVSPQGPSVKVYPNPSDNELFVQVPDFILPCKVTIYDYQGSVKWVSMLTSSTSQINHHLAPGFYFLLIESTNGVLKPIKFIVNKN